MNNINETKDQMSRMKDRIKDVGIGKVKKKMDETTSKLKEIKKEDLKEKYDDYKEKVKKTNLNDVKSKLVGMKFKSILRNKKLWLSLAVILFLIYIFGGGEGTVKFAVAKSSPEIQSINKKVENLEIELNKITSQKENLSNEWEKSDHKKNMDKIESLSEVEKEEYEKYGTMSSYKIWEGIENFAYEKLGIMGNNSPSQKLESYYVMHSQSFVDNLMKYLYQHNDRNKWSTPQECLTHYIDRINSDKEMTDKDLTIIKDFFTMMEVYSNPMYEKWKKYKNLYQGYNDGKTALWYLNDKKKDVDRKAEELSQQINEMKHKIAVKTGEVEPKDIYDYAILCNASNNTKYKSKPPLDGPSNGNQFFFWKGTLVGKDGDVYTVWDANYNLFNDMMNDHFNGLIQADVIDKEGFAFKNIKCKFGELQQDSNVSVVGRYVGNSEVTLVNGQTKTIPVLTDCYVLGS